MYRSASVRIRSRLEVLLGLQQLCVLQDEVLHLAAHTCHTDTTPENRGSSGGDTQNDPGGQDPTH